MKHILVPTDFSECAQFALDAAIQLARKFEASIHLFHSINFPAGWEELSAAQKKAYPQLLAKIDAALEAFESIKKVHIDLDITSAYAGGKLVDEVKKTIDAQGIDFVVMGSHGKSGASEIFIGSNTQKVVRMIHRPILVIKRPLKEVEFKNVVFASNFNLNEQSPFLKFKAFLAPFQAKIHFLGIITSYFFDVPASVTRSAIENFQQLAAPFDSEAHLFKKSNIEAGVREFSEKINADLIAISNFNRRPIKRMLMGSNVEALVNHSDIPVLSIDFEEN